MRVPEKYSTLPAEDRSVHIVNICAIEDLGYLPSEGTVSSGAATGDLSTALKALGVPTHARAAPERVAAGTKCTRPAILCASSYSRNAVPGVPRVSLGSLQNLTQGLQRPWGPPQCSARGSPECSWGLCSALPGVYRVF